LSNQPPIPWQARLAEWIQERFPLPERRRTYARPSRRQSATPEIPRPRFVEPEDERMTRTFGVIIDTSGSMERDELGKALGAVVSYSQAQAVKHVRLVYCDATPYDEGFVTSTHSPRGRRCAGAAAPCCNPRSLCWRRGEIFRRTAPSSSSPTACAKTP